jgi:hypothetical protein
MNANSENNLKFPAICMHGTSIRDGCKTCEAFWQSEILQGKTPSKPHNPDNLPSPGEPPWRFLMEGEEVCSGCQLRASTGEWIITHYEGLPLGCLTYRTRRPLPLPAQEPKAEGQSVVPKFICFTCSSRATHQNGGVYYCQKHATERSELIPEWKEQLVGKEWWIGELGHNQPTPPAPTQPDGTPRTDALERKLFTHGYTAMNVLSEYRDLERELAEAKAELIRLNKLVIETDFRSQVEH